MTKRTYHFELPYVISSFMLSMGWWQIHEDPLFAQLPAPLRKKIVAAHDTGSDLSITKADLDTIPDNLWPSVAGKFHLS